MCGIAGIASARAPIDSSVLPKLGEALAHRGPDGVGIWTSVDKRCGFVHNRLAIIDPVTRSDQPFISDDGNHTMVFNGEIFNFIELRRELESAGYRFRTDGDTEVLLNAVLAWGADALLRLNGMWALAIRDNRDGSIFLARDRFGIKPLYYAVNAGQLAFASELRALRRVPWVNQAPRLDVVRRQLFDPFGIEASQATLHEGIARLPAGHCATFAGGDITLRRWWRSVDHLAQDVPYRLGEAADRFRELFFDSIRLRMRSDVPIGTCLSGGFDSSAIVSAMGRIAQDDGNQGRQSGDWRHAFIATFEGHAHDESADAQAVARFAGVSPHLIDCGHADGVDLVDTVLDTMDDVYISLPTAPWLTYRRVRESAVRVTLDGHGADEMMGAYYPGRLSPTYALKNLLHSDRLGAGALTDWSKFAYLRAKGEYFVRQNRAGPPPAIDNAARHDRLPDHYSGLDQRLYRMFHCDILPAILRNFDRLSMAHGVEVRMPFMDWRLVTYVLALPAHIKANERFTKLVAREAMEDIMPEDIRTNRRKVGFNSQMPAWMNGSLGKWAAQLLATSNHAFDEAVDRAGVIARVNRLNARGEWTWSTVGRLWPYINMKWYLDRHAA